MSPRQSMYAGLTLVGLAALFALAFPRTSISTAISFVEASDRPTPAREALVPSPPAEPIPQDIDAPTAAHEAEEGDWSLLRGSLERDRAARFRVLDLLASGRIPTGPRREQLVAWLRDLQDDEVT